MVPIFGTENVDTVTQDIVTNAVSDRVVRAMTGTPWTPDFDRYASELHTVPDYHLDHGLEAEYIKEMAGLAESCFNNAETFPQYESAISKLAMYSGHEFHISYTNATSVVVLVEAV